MITIPKFSVFYSNHLNDPWVIETAKKYASQIAPHDTRSREQKYQDSLKGLALQLAVFEFLVNAGYDVIMEENRWEWDIILTHNGQQIHIDTKGLFTDSLWVNMTVAEWIYVPMLSFQVFYMAFRCHAGKADYIGWAKTSEFQRSRKPQGDKGDKYNGWVDSRKLHP